MLIQINRGHTKVKGAFATRAHPYLVTKSQRLHVVFEPVSEFAHRLTVYDAPDGRVLGHIDDAFAAAFQRETVGHTITRMWVIVKVEVNTGVGHSAAYRGYEVEFFYEEFVENF